MEVYLCILTNRTFANSDDGGTDPSRVGAASDPLMGGTIDSTTIGSKDNGSGNAQDLNRTHAKVTNQRVEKNLIHAFREITVMCERIGLSRLVIDSAKQLFKKVDEEKLLRGKGLESIMAACICMLKLTVDIGCREQNVTRTFKEICALTKVSKKEIGRCYKLLQPLFENPAQQISIDAYISRFSSHLSLPNNVQKAALQVTNKTMAMGILAGKSPISIVAACLYFVSCISDTKKNAKDIAETAGCTENTLRNAFKTLYENNVELHAAINDKALFPNLNGLPVL